MVKSLELEWLETWMDFNFMKNKSWRTTALGIACIVLGLTIWHQTWVHNQTVWFNLRYVGLGPLGWIVAGWIGIHAKDHRCDI
jgi:hypothetical protein